MPTPETADVPLTLQVIASLRAAAWAADVKGAFTQSEKGQRKKPLYVNPPPEGIPGETDQDLVIELLTEIYGLISGPPGWRKTLLAALKEFGFKNHPLAPCVVLMYDGKALVGITSIETDDLLGGGIGKKWTDAIPRLRQRF